MIRVDEIYNNTFWPYIDKNIPLTRLFFCDPPGRSDPDALFNFGHDVTESNYIFLHDQEPIHLDIHKPLFNDVVRRNRDLNHARGATHSVIVTSEYNSEFVEQVCSQYRWRPFYYFFHGWAAMDWYRGYDKTFLMPEPRERKIKHSFVNANRIIGGKREHRIVLMYLLLKNNISNALISFPRTCPAENVDILDLAANLDPAMVPVFQQADLPWCFDNEVGHPMHSCWLSLFQENSQSLAHVVTETVFYGRRHHLTEKTFKPICLRMPFVMVSAAGSLEYLKRYGFRTFSDIWDESYDDETNDDLRLDKISQLLKDLDDQSPQELQKIYQSTIPILEHNFQHFYGGAFESILWKELQDMLVDLRSHITHD
jgi:hypothetical protein